MKHLVVLFLYIYIFIYISFQSLSFGFNNGDMSSPKRHVLIVLLFIFKYYNVIPYNLGTLKP